MNWFKKALLALGAFLLAMILFAVCFAVFVGVPQDKEAGKISTEYAKRLAATWDYKDIAGIVDQAMKNAAPQEKTEQILAMCKAKLGALVSTENPQGTTNDYFNGVTMSLDVTAAYNLNAKFEKGPGTIRLTLKKHDGKWWLLGFNVNSPLFLEMPKPEGAPSAPSLQLSATAQRP